MSSLSFKCGSRLVGLDRPLVMGIINVTPDSFAVHCTSCSEAAVLSTASQMLQEGADILDIGGYSTRPGAAEVPEEEEWRRVKTGLSALRNTWPDVLVSVDTWRSGIARRAIEEYGADIINDVSGGLWDSGMEDVIAHARVPYILMHTGWTNPQQTTTCPYPDGVVSAVLGWLQERIDRMHQRGVTDVIADPGFGFGKTTEENWTLLRQMDVLQVLEVPILAGLSRKSMFYKTFGGGPEEALNATTAAHMVALERGADILRVHDVKAAKEAVTVYCNTRSSR